MKRIITIVNTFCMIIVFTLLVATLLLYHVDKTFTYTKIAKRGVHLQQPWWNLANPRDDSLRELDESGTDSPPETNGTSLRHLEAKLSSLDNVRSNLLRILSDKVDLKNDSQKRDLIDSLMKSRFFYDRGKRPEATEGDLLEEENHESESSAHFVIDEAMIGQDNVHYNVTLLSNLTSTKSHLKGNNTDVVKSKLKGKVNDNVTAATAFKHVVVIPITTTGHSPRGDGHKMATNATNQLRGKATGLQAASVNRTIAHRPPKPVVKLVSTLPRHLNRTTTSAIKKNTAVSPSGKAKDLTPQRPVQNTISRYLPVIPVDPEIEALVKGPVKVPDADKYYRLVHLDLKGAPPKLSYFKEVFPLFRRMGANGLLVEYEDMFPFVGELQVISAPNAYSASDIFYLQQLARENDLEYIPLVQTFGHMEFVLKHEKFQHLREDVRYSSALCPSHPESMDLVKSLVHQVMSLHRRAKHVHIGCDEVYYLARCQLCKYRNKKEFRNEKSMLFLSHVRRVATFVKQSYNVNLIIWDDMLRSLPKSSLMDLRGLVEPMVWIYSVTFNWVGTSRLWPKYLEAFDNVWAASAYKGSSGPHSYYCDIPGHIKNHHTWLDEINRHVPYERFRGYALTGWQRYDHYAITCELLPVAIPCLAFCLQSILHGGFSVQILDRVSKALGFPYNIPFKVVPGMRATDNLLDYNKRSSGNFSGNGVYATVVTLKQFEMSKNLHDLFDPNFSPVWSFMSDYQIKVGRLGHSQLESLLSESQKIHTFLSGLHNHTVEALSLVYDNETVVEWTAVYLEPWLSRIGGIVSKASEQLALLGEPEIADLQKKHNEQFVPEKERLKKQRTTQIFLTDHMMDGAHT
ncbi:hexosaminidase D-like [Ptychodera flava]|uniref:hexosaminidase D-like n=1 Tax=Ptychodera flava TaxID=63121 RepID=UPI00396A8568